MFRDMEVLTQQNLRLQRQLTDERAPKASEGHGEGERNTNEEEDRESKRAVERSQIGLGELKVLDTLPLVETQ
jgi:hypothetical protein